MRGTKNEITELYYDMYMEGYISRDKMNEELDFILKEDKDG